MGELWDLYDINRNKTGRTAQRGADNLKEREYHIVANAVILNSKNEILLSKRAAHKEFGLMWECSGGSVLAGETSLEGILREVREELGLVFSKDDAIHLKEIRRDKIPPAFKDLWLFRKNVDLKDITLPDSEAIDAKWVSIDEFMEMYQNKEIIPTVDFEIEDYNQALKILKNRKKI